MSTLCHVSVHKQTVHIVIQPHSQNGSNARPKGVGLASRLMGKIVGIMYLRKYQATSREILGTITVSIFTQIIKAVLRILVLFHYFISNKV